MLWFSDLEMCGGFGWVLLTLAGRGRAQFMYARTQCRHILPFLQACLEMWCPRIAAVSIWKGFLSECTSRCIIAVADEVGRVEKYSHWVALLQQQWATSYVFEINSALQLWVQTHAYTYVRAINQVMAMALAHNSNMPTDNDRVTIIRWPQRDGAHQMNVLEIERMWWIVWPWGESSFMSPSPIRFKRIRIRV